MTVIRLITVIRLRVRRVTMLSATTISISARSATRAARTKTFVTARTGFRPTGSRTVWGSAGRWATTVCFWTLGSRQDTGAPPPPPSGARGCCRRVGAIRAATRETRKIGKSAPVPSKRAPSRRGPWMGISERGSRRSAARRIGGARGRAPEGACATRGTTRRARSWRPRGGTRGRRGRSGRVGSRLRTSIDEITFAFHFSLME